MEDRPFRFADLIPEVRNRVYSMYLQDHATTAGGIDLARFSPPPITQVSQQLRSESLPVFFAETEFYVNVASNLSGRATRRHHQENNLQDPSNLVRHHREARQKSGVLNIKKALKAWIIGTGDIALFRNITIRIFDIDETTRYRNKNRLWPVQGIVATLRFDAKGTSTARWLVDSTESGLQIWSWGVSGYEACDLQEAIDLAEHEVKDIAARENFKGFTMGDLEAVARKFRFQYWNDESSMDKDTGFSMTLRPLK